MKNEAKELKKVTVQEMNSKVGKKTGNLRKGIKAGKVYHYKGNLAVRVYGGKPAHHAHLIDRGHRIVTPRKWRGKIRNLGGKEKGRARAFPFFEPSAKNFESKFEKDCEEFLDNLIIGRVEK